MKIMNLKSDLWGRSLGLAVGAVLLGFVAGCKRNSTESSGNDSGKSGKVTIQNAGSDTMVNLAQAWAEEYAKVDPNVEVEVAGGGSGTGIAALINGTCDLANSSRKVDPSEAAKAKQNTGKEPQEFMVGYDALAIYVHKDNPLTEITIEQLAQIYGEKGTISKWSQLGVTTGCGTDEIVVVSRQSSSGTYHYFREAILGKERDYRLGTRDMNGSKEVVELVGSTPCAMGYSGLAYGTAAVKRLRVAKKKGDPTYEANVENTLQKTYPIARPMYMYSAGSPSGPLRKYLSWIMSDAGQKVVGDIGYIPLPANERKLPQ
jgi:phosphate transport system substrate-binding protein